MNRRTVKRTRDEEGSPPPPPPAQGVGDAVQADVLREEIERRVRAEYEGRLAARDQAIQSLESKVKALQRQNERLEHHKNLVARMTSTSAAAWATYERMASRAPSLAKLGLPEITNERRFEINKSWASIRKELLPLTDDGSNEKEHIHKFMGALISMVIESAGLRSTLRSHPEPTLIGLNSSARIPDACLTEVSIEKPTFET